MSDGRKSEWFQRSDPQDGLRLMRSFSGATGRQTLSYIAMADRADVHLNAGFRDCTQLVSAELGISSYKARAMVAASHAIESLPRIAEALRTGNLSLDKTLELCRFATPFDEDKLIHWAAKVTLGAVKATADQACAIPKEEVQEAERARFLSLDHDPDNHRHWFMGCMPEETGWRFATALEAAAKDIPLSPEDGPDGREARYLDALIELVLGAERPSSAPKDTLVVHASLDALLEGTENATLEGGGVLAPSVAGRLLCDCKLQFITYNENGCIGIGRTSPKVPKWLERQVRYRDGYRCSFPGCNSRHYLASHHMEFWDGDEGPTDLPNLTTLCPYHHKLVHEFGWRVRRTAPDEVTWFRPDGTRYRSGPAPPERSANVG